MVTTAEDVGQVVGCLRRSAVQVRVAGGWGVDALLGKQTREHRDLDLAIPAEQLATALDALARLGFTVTTDWQPVRVELSAGERHIDLHPLRYRADGSAWQAGLGDTRFDYPQDAWTGGRVDGLALTCLTPAMQRLFHSGYPHRAVDRHDLEMLDRVDADRPSSGLCEEVTRGPAR